MLKKSNIMILVTGATGHFGKETIDFLLKNGIPAANIAALIRNNEKAVDLKKSGIQISIGNYDDYASLVAAFKGIDKLLFVSGSEIEKRDVQHGNIVDAAKEASVKHIIYTSFQRKNDDEDSPLAAIGKTHIQTDKLIIASGIDYTIMRNALYAEGLPMFLGPKVLESGIFLPAGDGKAPYASRLDMAEAAAHILMGDGHLNKIYKIVGDKQYTFNDIAAILSDVNGQQVSYISPTPELFQQTLINAGVPKEIIGVTGIFMAGVKQGYFECDETDLPKLIGRKPTELKTLLSSIYELNRGN